MAGDDQSRTTAKAHGSAAILEGIVSGMIESCGSVRLSELGRAASSSLAFAHAGSPVRELCNEIFRRAGRRVLRQEFFVMSFVELLGRGEGVFERIAAQLERPSYALQMKELAHHAGVGPIALLCLLAIEFKEESRKRRVLIQEGDLVRMAEAQDHAAGK
jgi:hypothetical protein